MSYSELYRVLPLSSCAFNVCGSYAHFRFFIPHTNFIEQKYESAPLVLQVTTICMMTIHWFQVLIPLILCTRTLGSFHIHTHAAMQYVFVVCSNSSAVFFSGPLGGEISPPKF